MPRLQSIIGQTAALGAIRRSLERGVLPGGYLITGPESAGKAELAAAVAQAACCTDPQSGPFDACGLCESCRLAERGAHPDIVTIHPAGEQTQIWQLWDRPGRPPGALGRSLTFAPAVGRRRAIILESCERLTGQAANSLLKSLEEPPPYFLFLLLAPHPSRVLPTIASRSQTIRLLPMSRAELMAELASRTSVSTAQAGRLAALADGWPARALELAARPDLDAELASAAELGEAFASSGLPGALKLAEQLRKFAAGVQPGSAEVQPPVEEGDAATPRERTARRQVTMALDLLLIFYQDLVRVACGASTSGMTLTERMERLRPLAATRPPSAWMACADALLRSRAQVEANANVALLTDVLAAELLSR